MVHDFLMTPVFPDQTISEHSITIMTTDDEKIKIRIVKELAFETLSRDTITPMNQPEATRIFCDDRFIESTRTEDAKVFLSMKSRDASDVCTEVFAHVVNKHGPYVAQEELK